MKKYLTQIDPSWCEALVFTGGEPLLYLPTIKEILKITAPLLHKRIYTNGSLLTQEIVDYLNENQVEVTISHDGRMTEYLRGRDVLTEKDLLDLIRQINTLSIMSVITNKNTDIIDNYNYIVEKLDREDISYYPYQVYDNGYCKELIDGFNYDEFGRTWREYRNTIYIPNVHTTLENEIKKNLFNVTLEGNVVDKNTLEQYGTVFDTVEYCMENRDKAYANKYCANSNCKIKHKCKAPKENASEHYCKCIKIVEGYI